MVVILSPAKRMDFKSENTLQEYSIPDNLEKTNELIEVLRKLSPKELSSLMNINAKLVEENFERFAIWNKEFSLNNSRQSILAFKGDVFLGLNAGDFTMEDFAFAQDHLRILSGFHGVLRPLDLVQPYRLEMGTKIKVGKSENLYDFWQEEITRHLKSALGKDRNPVLINLASNEYFRAVDTSSLKSKIISPDFREFKEGKYKFVHIFGKRARGLMARFIIKNRIQHPDELKLFDLDGYEYHESLSTAEKPVFTRG